MDRTHGNGKRMNRSIPTTDSAALGRRVTDFAFAVLCLALVLPVMLLAAIAILLTDGRPVFFRQERIGQHGVPFQIWKFRSMKRNEMRMDGTTEIRKGHPLVTPVGRFLRRCKIDELPQLFNILAGEMAFLGPRPTVREQVVRYTPFQRRRLAVPPGLSGLSQVCGGIDIPWSERILVDVWYVDHRNVLVDARILFWTMYVVLFGERRDDKVLQQAREYAAAQGAPDGRAVDFHGDNLATAEDFNNTVEPPLLRYHA